MKKRKIVILLTDSSICSHHEGHLLDMDDRVVPKFIVGLIDYIYSSWIGFNISYIIVTLY